MLRKTIIYPQNSYLNAISKKRPLIFHVITSLDVGGAEVMLSRLLEVANKDRFAHRVVCLTRMGVIGKKIAAKGIKVTSLDMPSGRVSLKGLCHLAQLIKTEPPVVLQTWLYHADLVGLLLGKLYRIPNIIWNIRCSHIDLGKYRRTTQWVLKICATLSSFPQGIVSNSSEAVRFHTQLGYSAKSWHIIPNGIDLRRFKPDLAAKERVLNSLRIENRSTSPTTEQPSRTKMIPPVIIGCVARFDPMKDHATFIKAALKLLEIRSNVHFVLVGRHVTWENTFFKEQIPFSLYKHFHLLGERDDIEILLPAFDISSLSSYGEGFPNVIVEAMACGIPCVVTDVGDCAKIVGNTGVVVPPRDADALFGGWQILLKMSQNERQGMGRKARQRITDHYDIATIARKYEDIYQSFIDEHHIS